MIEIKLEKPLIFQSPNLPDDIPVRLLAARYHTDSSIALLLVSDDGIGEPVCTCTVCMPEIRQVADVLPNEVFIKDWSENEGMYDWLLANDIIEPTGESVHVGFVEARIGRLPQKIYDTIIQEFARHAN